jgi:hypothetical protein
MKASSVPSASTYSTVTRSVSPMRHARYIGRNPIEILKDHIGRGGQRDADAASDDIADRDGPGGRSGTDRRPASAARRCLNPRL